MNNSSFFCNKDCECFPCHATNDPDSFNCLFCYCPLYTLGEKCGGKFSYTSKGIKNCSSCLLPHSQNAVNYIRSRFAEISALAKVRQSGMIIVCLDLEGVLFPEIWAAFSEACGISELRYTTRDEPDYDKLMKYRIGILKLHGFGLKEIQTVIDRIDPLPGSKEFFDKLRDLVQTVIVSDTFEQIATPIAKKLGLPTILCNTLKVEESGEITGYQMRCQQSKLATVRAFQAMGYDTIAVGDSYNDLDMIRASKTGFLLNPPDTILSECPDIPAFRNFGDLLNAIKNVLENSA